MNEFFLELTLLICIATVFAIIFKVLKQPAILGYILAGIVVGPFGQFQLMAHDEMRTLAQLGVTLLLFMLGLELRFSELKSIGPAAAKVGILQIFLTGLVSYILSIALGFEQNTAIFLSIALTFASTIIIVKLLSDKKDLNSLYGKISLGMLLVQDFIAILILILLSAFGTDGVSIMNISSLVPVLGKGIILFGVILYLSKEILPRITHNLARSPEILFLFSLAWVFGLSAIVSSSYIGFTIEIGGFLAGLALANSLENYQIVARVRALRDFFITIFFVTLGMDMSFSSMEKIWMPILVFILFVIIVKPLILMGIMGLLGYRKRTTFLTGINVGQVSEFSLIILFLGNRAGYISSEVISIITFVSIITFATSTYLIMAASTIYRKIEKYLFIFELSNPTAEKNRTTSEMESLKNHIVLIGVNRMGKSILKALQEDDEKVLVIDFNPDVVQALQEKGVMSIFGDIADIDIHERAQFDKARLIISTVGDIEDNLFLIENLKAINAAAKIVVIAHYPHDEEALYKAGADYVVMPYVVGGKHIAHLVKHNALDKASKYPKKEEK